MRNIFALSTVFFAAAGLLGCDQQASQNAAQRELETALREIQTAEIGYVPASNSDQTIWAYRDAALDKATPALRNVMQSGSPKQKVIAARQLALIDLSGARFQAREAMTVNAEIAAQSGSLLRHADAVARAYAMTQELSLDSTDAITELEAGIAETQKAIDQRQQEADGLREQVEGYRSKADAALDESRQLQTRSAEARDRAFVTRGDAHYSALDEAAKYQREAQKASTQADLENARLEELSRELVVLQTDIDGGNEAVKSLKERIADIMDRDAVRDENRAAAEDGMGEIVELMLEEFRGIEQRFANEFEAPMDSARERVTNALSLLTQAQSSARGTEKNAVTGDRLTALSDQVYLLTEQAAATASHANVLSVLNGVSEAMPAESAGQVADAYERAIAKRDQLVGEAEAAQQEAKELAGGLGDDAASKQIEQLSVYDQRISALK